MASFKVKARTVDMLGRQQIAGIPTAISELFKNAHDAYARKVEVDYFRNDNLLVLRDNGLGMSRQDFEDRWLTLGTDSKLGVAGGLPPPPKDPKQKKRPILGSKGIGRLAIAIIGPQVVILSRARLKGKPSDTTIGAYVHWGLFELPGLDIDDIEIPIHEFEEGTLPDAQAIKNMISEVEESLDEIENKSNRVQVRAIRRQISQFEVNPARLNQELGDPSLFEDGCGTHFYIMPVEPVLANDLDERESERTATKFERHLIGFSNTMTPDHVPPPIVTKFRDYIDEGSPIERIGEKAFFSPEEYREVDHHFIGRFDERGQFRGTVGIYQTTPEDYVLNWDGNDGQPTDCGPFTMAFAYLQGKPTDSLVPPEEHARLDRKLDRYGGLYIYKDGVRVQPYGNSDYDFLDIERRRTFGAAYYFFSYRRMMGVIELSEKSNWQLSEKAGREGFRENRAYRQFRAILVNFFLQTAADFFREEGALVDTWQEKRDELSRTEEVRTIVAQSSSSKQRELRSQLRSFFDGVDRKEPEAQVDQILSETKSKVDRTLRGRQSGEKKSQSLQLIERVGRKDLQELQSDLFVEKPRGVGMPKELASEWEQYEHELQRITQEVIAPAEVEIEKYISKSSKENQVSLDHKSRLEKAISERGRQAKRQASDLKKTIEQDFRRLSEHVTNTAQESFASISKSVEDAIAEADAAKLSASDTSRLTQLRKKLEGKIENSVTQEMPKLEQLRDQLLAIGMVWEEEGYDVAELSEALGEELEELRDRRDANLELAQIGMALSTITHEFEKTVGAVRDGFRRMKAWAEANPDMRSLYNDMRSSFDHLDNYLSLFTPLDRRLDHAPTKISGEDIWKFLSDLFELRLERHKVELSATSEFRKMELTAHRSIFYPVFVNLVDNAIFWLQRQKQEPRRIELDAEHNLLVVRDNGPGVSARDRENIFRLNFTRKPGGRGMGLYICRESLGKAGYEISLDSDRRSQGATFRITPANGK